LATDEHQTHDPDRVLLRMLKTHPKKHKDEPKAEKPEKKTEPPK
jgi:hypothetical protein